MVEASQSIRQAQRQRDRMLVMVLAQQAAMKAAKQAMQRRGIKVNYIARRDMVAAAQDYLTTELIAATAL